MKIVNCTENFVVAGNQQGFMVKFVSLKFYSVYT